MLSKIQNDAINLNEEDLNEIICKHINETSKQTIPLLKPSMYIFTARNSRTNKQKENSKKGNVKKSQQK